MSDTKKEIKQQVVEKALKDETFRNKLKSDPKGTMEEMLGVKMPEKINLSVHQEDPENVHIVIPHSPQKNELSEEELSGVAGGTDTWSVTADSSCMKRREDSIF